MKRASEVPPVVLSSGVRPVTAPIASVRQSLTGPGGTRKDSPLTSHVSAYLPPIGAGRHKKGFAAASPRERVFAADRGEPLGDPGLQLVAGPQIVEADVEGGA